MTRTGATGDGQLRQGGTGLQGGFGPRTAGMITDSSIPRQWAQWRGPIQRVTPATESIRLASATSGCGEFSHP